MAKRVSELSVFVASPDDVSEERQALEDTIRELNVLWGRTKGIRLDLVRWETHAYPSFGVDAQAVVNEQIGDDYDIFVGILWKKFGTPTGRAASGTEEEFNRAYERHKQDPGRLRIMFYFRTSPVDLEQIDPEQLALVKRFREQLGEKGSLYWTYRTKEEFANLVRMHLSLHIEDWGKTWGTEVPQPAVPAGERATGAPAEEVRTEREEAEEEEGFLDLLEVGNESFESLTSLAERIASAIQTLGEKTSQRADELGRATGGAGAPDVRAAKRICASAADDLDQYSSVMEAEVPVFAELFEKGIDAHSRAASLLPDFASQGEDVTDPLSRARSALETLHETMQESQRVTRGFRGSIAGIPRMTTRYNRSRRRALAILDRFIGEVDSAVNQVEETLATYDLIRRSVEGGT